MRSLQKINTLERKVQKMIYKVHWIVDGVAEIEADSKEDAEKKLQESLEDYVKNSKPLMDKFYAKSKFVKILKFNSLIGTGNVQNTNFCEISICDTEMKKK